MRLNTLRGENEEEEKTAKRSAMDVMVLFLSDADSMS